MQGGSTGAGPRLRVPDKGNCVKLKRCGKMPCLLKVSARRLELI